MYYNNITGRATAILLITFALVAGLAILGVFLQYAWKVDTGLITEAMRIIGISGPTGTAIQSTADVVRELKRPGSATSEPNSTQKPGTPGAMALPDWSKKE